MPRKAFTLHLRPGQDAEYVARHVKIWPELVAVLRAHGASRYSIFRGPGDLLFAYVEVEDEARWDAIARTEVCQRWWRHMSDIMPSHPDHRPIAENLPELFHLD